MMITLTPSVNLLRLWFSLWTSAVLCSADAGRFWAVLWRWWSTLHAPVGVKLLGQQTWNQKASVLPVPQFLPPALIFRPEGRLTANNNSRLLGLSCRQKHCSSQTVLQIHADVSAPTPSELICESETCNRVSLDFMISCITENNRASFCSRRVQLPLHDLQVLVEDLRSVSVQRQHFCSNKSGFYFMTSPKPPWSHLALVLVWSHPLKVLVLALFPPSCYNGGVFLWLEVLRTEDKVHCSNQEASQSSKQLIYICGVFRGSGF